MKGLASLTGLTKKQKYPKTYALPLTSLLSYYFSNGLYPNIPTAYANEEWNFDFDI